MAVTAADAEMLPSYDLIIEDDAVIEVGRLRLRTIATPGHTPGSICFAVEGTPLLFSGDTLFPGGPGATKFPGGDFPTIIRSIEERHLPALRATTPWCCPGTAPTPPSATSAPTCRSGSTGAGEPRGRRGPGAAQGNRPRASMASLRRSTATTPAARRMETCIDCGPGPHGR